MKLLKIVQLSLFGLVLALGACKSTVEGQKQRYSAVKDRLDALATKMPQFKADIQAKLAEFDAQEKQAEAMKGDDAIKALQALVARMDSYEKNLNPQTPPPAGSTSSGATGSKVAPPAPTPAGSTTTSQAPSKSGFGGK